MTGIANADQHEAWNGDSGQRWVADPERRDRVMAPIADALLARAGAQPGWRVLDVGCGCGATTLAVADTVEPGGTVTGVDLSEPMLDVARQRRESAGIKNVDFVQADAQTHEFSTSFDLAISRFGTMFFADPAAAFTNIGAALLAGGRLCLATWQPLSANDWLTIPGAALLRYGTMPAIGGGEPGMFAQSDPDTVTAVLAGAGYVDIDFDPVDLTLVLGTDPAEATDYLAESGVGRAVLATVADRDRAAALDAVRTALVEHTDDAGVHLGAAVWIITATRPA